ncbi:phosphotransferase [Tropicibacter oceani]|uniref:Phosphotransferase n=1 Tax=Tropicibacter oceani TaxID=3058420 RepID=A0ABY8QNF4_9RHOB|nr:phosphotransferase [Tropicibacter oceani]WGW05998.1 phosphotransferase [Tropicibacter oceani]
MTAAPPPGPDWPALLRDFYGLPPGTRFTAPGPGRHVLLQVTPPEGRALFFKGRAEAAEDAGAGLAGLAFQDHVARHGGPAPGVQRGRGGALMLCGGQGAQGALHDCLTGRPATTDPADAEALGQALARIHALGDGWSGAADLPCATRATLVDLPAARIRGALDVGFDPELRGLIAALGDWIDGLPRGRGVFGPCHGDSHYENAACDGFGALCFYDFEHAVRGWRAFDLASFIWGCFRQERGAQTWNAFMQGYGAQRPLSEAEATWIRPFLVVRQLWWLGFNAGAEGPLSDKMQARLTQGLGFVTHLADQVGAREAMARPGCPA